MTETGTALGVGVGVGVGEGPVVAAGGGVVAAIGVGDARLAVALGAGDDVGAGVADPCAVRIALSSAGTALADEPPHAATLKTKSSGDALYAKRKILLGTLVASSRRIVRLIADRRLCSSATRRSRAVTLAPARE